MKNNYLYKRCKILLLLMSIIALTFLACATPKATVPESKMVEKPVTLATKAEVSWEQQWEELVKAARKEGRLTIYSGLERDTILDLRKNFGEKYGVDLEITSAGSAQLNAKLFTERQNGLYIPDLYIEGPTSPLVVYKPQKIIQSLDKVLFRPDVLDPKVWWRGYGPFFDKAHVTAGGAGSAQAQVAINTRLVRSEELISYNDLLDPKWKGRILIGDPTVSGGPSTVMHNALIIMGEDYIKKLAEQAGMITRDKRLLVEWVVREKYPIAFGATNVIVEEFKREGVANLDMIVFKEGSSITATGVVVLFDRPPHPNAARLFINWFLTKEAQQSYVIAASRMSRRLDVSDEHLAPYNKRKEGINYFIQDEEYYLKTTERQVILDKYYKK